MDTLPLPDVGDTLARIAILSPTAQIVALLVLGGVLGLLVWSRRPQPGPGMETFNLVIASMNEQTRATIQLSENVERVIEQNAVIIARLPVGTMERAG